MVVFLSVLAWMVEGVKRCSDFQSAKILELAGLLILLTSDRRTGKAMPSGCWGRGEDDDADS